MRANRSDGDLSLPTTALTGVNTGNARFVVPADARPGQTIHLVLGVADGGETPMTRYQRVVVTVAGNTETAIR